MATPPGVFVHRIRDLIHRCAWEENEQVSPADWQERLRLAVTDAEVIALARDHLAMLHPAEVALLPPRCQPRELVCAHDISSYAFDLVGHYGEATNASVQLINRLAVFFTQASIRLSEIVSASHGETAAGGRASTAGAR
jgi:hypothetical protein